MSEPKLAEGVANLAATAQRLVDAETQARSVLAAAIQARVDFRASLPGESQTVVTGIDAVAKFIDDYVNPREPTPEPIAPEVAAPPPAQEPPVFTDVSTPLATADTTSGGSTEVSTNIPVPPMTADGTSDVTAAPPIDVMPEPAPPGDAEVSYPPVDGFDPSQGALSLDVAPTGE